jgi:hypothetical protein
VPFSYCRRIGHSDAGIRWITLRDGVVILRATTGQQRGRLMNRKALRSAGNLILVVLSIGLSLALLEILVRISFPIYDPSGHVQFERLSDGTPIGPRDAVFRQIKNTGDYDVEVRFNDLGLRDDKPLANANKRANALFVVGDSMAFGWGIDAEKRFSDRLQDILDRPVFNIAAGGADLDGYRTLVQYAEANGAVVENLIISVTMENDLHDYHRRPSREAAIKPQRVSLPPLDLSRLKSYLTGNSGLYVLATHAVHQTTWLQCIAAQLGLIRPNLEGIGNEKVSDEALASSVLRLRELAAGRNAVTLVIPSRRLWVGETARRNQASRGHAAFVDGLRTSGMKFVDMRARLESGGRPLSYHFANDGHWNAAAHQLASEALSEVLAGRD